MICQTNSHDLSSKRFGSQFDLARYRTYAVESPRCHPIITIDAVPSTNRYVMAIAADIPDYWVIVADHQSAGQGRSGRAWHSPAGTSLLCSVLVRPTVPLDAVHWLTMIAGCAAVAAIQQTCGLALQLKWPNDVIAVDEQGQWHKVGGILTETALDIDKIAHAVIGMGINVNLDKAAVAALNNSIGREHLRATSLAVLAGKTIEREQLLAAWMAQLMTRIATAETGVSPHAQWQAQLAGMGQKVQVGDVTGVLVGVDHFGRIVVDDGRIQHVRSVGDVSLRKNETRRDEMS